MKEFFVCKNRRPKFENVDFGSEKMNHFWNQKISTWVLSSHNATPYATEESAKKTAKRLNAFVCVSDPTGD